MKIGFFGSGIFASSLAYAISQTKKHELFMYDKFSFYKEDIDAQRTTDVSKFFANNLDFIFIGVPSSVFIDAIKDIPIKYDAQFVICTKGISDSKDTFFSDILEKHLQHDKISILSGPNFAIEILNNTETITTIASKDLKNAEIAGKLFQQTHIETEYSSKIYQTQIFGALKNVMAIYIGYLYGKKHGMNHILKHTMQILKEAFLLASKFDKDIQILSSCVIGDTILTCFNEKSRNRSFGEAIAKGEGKEFLSKNTVEGYSNTFVINKLGKECGLELKSFKEVLDLVCAI